MTKFTQWIQVICRPIMAFGLFTGGSSDVALILIGILLVMDAISCAVNLTHFRFFGRWPNPND